MIKLKPLLLERHQEDLYHATYENELLNILKNNAIKLAFVGGTQADQEVNKGYPFFLSAMRSKYGNFARGRYDSTSITYNVVIHLDGRALQAAGYKTFWVDYWGGGPMRSEQEERIASNKDEITPIGRFIKDVHVYVKNTKETISNSHSSERLHEIDRMAHKFPFPIYFYLHDQEQAFKAQRTEKAVRTIKDLVPQPSWTPDELQHKKWLDDNPRKNESKILRTFVDIYYDKPVDTSTYPGQNVMRWLLYYPHDAQSQISAEIHNLKKSHAPIFREFVKIMKDGGFKTVRELVEFVIKRDYARETERREAERKEDAKRLAQKKPNDKP